MKTHHFLIQEKEVRQLVKQLALQNYLKKEKISKSSKPDTKPH